MAEKSQEQLQKEILEQQALAAGSRSLLDAEKVTLRQQQSELRRIQGEIIRLDQTGGGASPESQRIFFDSINALEQRQRSLQQAIVETNNRINALATQAVNYENSAQAIQQQIQQQNLQGQSTTTTVQQTTTAPNTVEATPNFPTGNVTTSQTEVNISGPLQANTVVVPDPNEFVGPLPPAAPPVSSPPSTENYRGPSRDDDGNLLPGWDTDELGIDFYAGPNFVSEGTFANTYKGLLGAKNLTRAQATLQDATIYKQTKDWRVKLSLAPGATYLYKDPNAPGILKPLQATDGIIFPYTPDINVQYSASYDAPDIAHSNYKIWQYKGSGVDSVSINCEFTAQDTAEATYLLAVIHFLRTVTKMFYGQDQVPKPGTPPPLCYLSGLGEFQFNQHPLVVNQFTYSLPSGVDYIRAGPPPVIPTQTLSGYIIPNNAENPSNNRLSSNRLQPGARPPLPNFNAVSNTAFVNDATYVPTKMTINIGCYPIVSRYDISKKFSLKEYGSGQLLRGSTRSPKGGIW